MKKLKDSKWQFSVGRLRRSGKFSKRNYPEFSRSIWCGSLNSVTENFQCRANRWWEKSSTMTTNWELTLTCIKYLKSGSEKNVRQKKKLIWLLAKYKMFCMEWDNILFWTVKNCKVFSCNFPFEKVFIRNWCNNF